MVEVIFNALAGITRCLLQRRRVTILVYHNIPEPLFEEHVKRLAGIYSFISFSTYIEYKEGRLEKLPSYPLIITFDDGYKENHKLLPIFKRYGIHPSIYLCTHPLDSNRIVWSSSVKGSANVKSLLEQSFEKAMAEVEKQGFGVNKEIEGRTFLDRAEIEEMRQWVDFQSHTANHANLAMASRKTVANELLDSKKKLEAMGIRVNTICYPFGNYSKTVIELAKEAGYRYGVTVEPFYNTVKTHPFKIRRLSMNNVNPRLVRLRASGLYSFLKEFMGQRKGMRKYIDK